MPTPFVSCEDARSPVLGLSNFYATLTAVPLLLVPLHALRRAIVETHHCRPLERAALIYWTAMLTLLFRVSEKTATPTSVVLMGLNTALGFAYRQFVQGGVEHHAWGFLAVCAPVVVIGAPLGSVVGSHFHRLTLASEVAVGLVAGTTPAQHTLERAHSPRLAATRLGSSSSSSTAIFEP